MKFLVGKKLKMTRVFDQDGVVIPVTAVEAKPTEVFEIKTSENSGYAALKVKVVNRKKLRLMEFRAEESDLEGIKPGDKIEVKTFTVGDKVKVVGISKGKGFAGTIKRYGFHQGPKTHGSNQQRRVGSIGAAYPEHVLKGQRMPGRMGGGKVTVKNLRIVDVDAENNIILVSGAIPGPKGTEVRIIGT